MNNTYYKTNFSEVKDFFHELNLFLVFETKI